MDLKSQLLEVFVKYLLPVLATAIASALIWVLAQLGRWLAAKFQGTKVGTALVKLDAFAELVVMDLEATMRPEIQKASEDGQLTAEEGKALKDTAMKRVKALLAEHGLKEIQAVLGIFAPQVDSFISGAIEKAVVRTKAVPASP